MSVTAALGFRAAGVAAGLKSGGAPDVALVVNDGPGHAAAGVVTSNTVKAAPVLWTQQVLRTGALRAVVLNSGGANACTGPPGFADTHATAEHVAGLLGVGAIEVAVCSTGLIGERLPMDRLLRGTEAAHSALCADGGLPAAQAIMTTDTRPKQAEAGGQGWHVGGMAKGAGMLAPGLATMLVLLTTDADVDAGACDRALRSATRTTFDRVDSDGCMSTNDTVLLMASGDSCAPPAAHEVDEAVRTVSHDLAMQLVSDAEGADHDIAVHVLNARTEADALEAARAVARSALFKCAVFGRDPNWGRILAAVGTTSAAFDPLQVSVTVNGVTVCRDGGVGDDRSMVDLSGRQVDVSVDLGAGRQRVTVWTNDLTHAYVHENSAYST